jgi:hypothetical protein
LSGKLKQKLQESNENKNPAYQNHWDIVKTMRSACIKKTREISNRQPTDTPQSLRKQ